jgi:outer membrane autotransporter protein
MPWAWSQPVAILWSVRMKTIAAHRISERARRGRTRQRPGARRVEETPVLRKARRPVAAVFGATLGLGIAATSVEAQFLGPTVDDFGVLAGSTVTNTGPSVISGSVGVSPGTAITGFPPGIVLPPGTIHAGDAVAAQAQVELTAAYNSLQGLPSQFNLTGQNLGGLTLTPAVYTFATSAQLTGVLTLNGLGNPAAQFVFQIGSTLTTASNSAVLLINGANGNNVYWAVGSSATLGTNSVFAGNIIALTSITLNTGASITCGRALARNGAVTLDNNVITLCVSGSGNGTDITDNDLFGGGLTGAQQSAFGASGMFASAMMGQGAMGLSGQDLMDDTQTNTPSIKDGGAGSGASKLGGPVDEKPVILPYQPNRWRLWTAGFGGSGQLKGDPAVASASQDSRTAGVAVGIEHRVDPWTRVGIAGGYSNSHFSVDQQMTKGTLEGVHAGVYGVRRFGPFYVAGTVDYAHYSNDSRRSIDWVVDERASGEFSSDVLSARLEVGWRRPFGRFLVTPFAGLNLAHLWSDGFTENSVSSTGAPGILGLTFGDESVNSIQSSLGVQVDTRTRLSNGQILTPFARVAWLHEFNPDRSVHSFLTASPAAAFSPFGAFAATNLAKVNAGVRLDVTGSLAVFGYFDGEFSNQGQSYGGTGGVKIFW